MSTVKRVAKLRKRLPKNLPFVEIMALPALDVRCWALLTTGPHVGWHVSSFFRHKWMAEIGGALIISLGTTIM